MKLEEIHYLDHWEDQSGWVEDYDVDLEGMNCRSVGYVIAENESVLRLCSHFDDNKRVFGSYTILKSAIVKRTVIHE